MPRFFAESHLIVGSGLYTRHGIYVEHVQVIQYFGIET